MKTEDEKMMEFGRMVFGLVTDVINTPEGTAYGRRRITMPGRRRITMPDGHGGKLAVVLFIAKDDELAEVWERAARESFNVTDIVMPSSERKQ